MYELQCTLSLFVLHNPKPGDKQVGRLQKTPCIFYFDSMARDIPAASLQAFHRYLVSILFSPSSWYTLDG